MSRRPPFTVPPEELDSWDEGFENVYSEWKCNDIYSKSSKEDYRQFVSNLNNEYNVEEVYDALEAGLEAFEKLITCTHKFPKFDLDEDLDAVYRKEEHTIVKDFIKWGFKFVDYYQNGENSDLVENDGVVAETANTELSQLSGCQETIRLAIDEPTINVKDNDMIRKTFVDKIPLSAHVMPEKTPRAKTEQ